MAVVTAHAEFVVLCGACSIPLAYRPRLDDDFFPQCLEHPDAALRAVGHHLYLLEAELLTAEGLWARFGDPPWLVP